jgi:hypothetical protein
LRYFDSHFIPERTVSVIDSLERKIAFEVLDKIGRWKGPSSYENWENSEGYFHTFLVARGPKVVRDVQ